jgi:hypothetical protein
MTEAGLSVKAVIRSEAAVLAKSSILTLKDF